MKVGWSDSQARRDATARQPNPAIALQRLQRQNHDHYGDDDSEPFNQGECSSASFAGSSELVGVRG